MSDLLVLSVLKFAGLAIGLATTIWGMTRKTTSEDESGRKRLTPAGHVAVALALGSFLIAGASQGFETLARQAQERNQKLETAERARREEAKEARDFRNEQRGKRSLDLQILTHAQALSQAAEARAARAEQRLLSLKAEAEQRERDLALSRDVNRGAQQNLARAQQTLGEIDRLINEIDDTVVITARWKVPLGGIVPGLTTLAQSLNRASAASAKPPGVHRVQRANNSVAYIYFTAELLPTLGRLDRERLENYINESMTFHFFAGERNKLSDADIRDGQDLTGRGEAPRLNGTMGYDPRDDTFSFATRMEVPLVRITDRIVSVDELRRASVVVQYYPSPPPELTQEQFFNPPPPPSPIWIRLQTSGRVSQARGFKMVPGSDGSPTLNYVGKFDSVIER